MAAPLIVGFVLLTQGALIKHEVATIDTSGPGEESPLRRVLTEFGKLVGDTLEIRFQRDAFLLEVAHRKHGHPLGTTERDTVVFSQVHEGIRDSIPNLDANPAWFSPDVEVTALDGLKARTVAKAVQLIEAARADGIELKVVPGYRNGEPRRNFLGFGEKLSPLSTHSTGFAFDVLVLKNGRVDFGPSEELDRVGAIGQRLGLIWGGEFPRCKVWSHFELPIARRELSRLKSEADPHAVEAVQADARLTR